MKILDKLINFCRKGLLNKKQVLVYNEPPAIICNIKKERDYLINYLKIGDFIIKFKKEDRNMDARVLVLEQKRLLEVEKPELVKKLKESKLEEINVIRQKAADEAEALFVEKLEESVDNQYKIAEEHLNALLVNLPAEETETNEANNN